MHPTSRPEPEIPPMAYCTHYLERGDLIYYCNRDRGHPAGHSAPDHQAGQTGMYVQWLTGDRGDAER